MHRIRPVLFSNIMLLIFISVLYTSVWAQSGSTASGITGIASDEQGRLIGGVAIGLKNADTNLTRNVKTNNDGAFFIAQLAPGNYELTAAAEGFKTETINIVLDLGTTKLVTIKMVVGTTSDVVEVTADNMASEGKTESSTNINRQRIDTLPINRRNFLDFSLTAARVTVDRLPPQGASATSGLSFNGQNPRANNVTIDGLDNNDVGSGSVRSTFGQDAVQEFQVVSDSYSAEFGRALGGVVNIVTRSGSNDYHGGLFFFNRNDEISSRDVFAPFKPDYKQYQFGTTFSGPIKKDRAFFFTSFERLSIKQNNFVTISDSTIGSINRIGFPLRNGPVAFSIGQTTFLGRADVQLAPNDTLYVRYNFGGTYNGALEPFGGLTGETNGGVQRLDDNTIAVSNTYINTNLNLVNETRFIYGRRDQDVLQLDDGPQVRLIAPEGQVIFGRGIFLPQPRRERIDQIIDNVTIVRGRNQTKFGFDFLINRLPDFKTKVPVFAGGLALFNPIDFSALTGLPGLPSFTGLQTFDPAQRTVQQRTFLVALSSLLPIAFPGFPRGLPLVDMPLPTAFAQGFGDTALEGSVKIFSSFVQDEIKLKPNLLLKLGLRYDIARTKFAPENNGNFAPRVALSYRSERLSGLTVRAGYGIFYAGAQAAGVSFAVQNTSVTGRLKLPIITFPFSILPFSTPLRRFPESNDLPAGVTLVPQLSQAFTYSKDIRNSYTQQTTLGFDYLIGNDTAISATYYFVRGIKLFASRNINPIVRPIPGDPVTSALVGRVDPTQGDLYQFETSFDSYYHAVTLALNRRFTKRFGVLAHYTLSKTIDNFIDFRVDQEGSLAVDPLRPRNERSLSLQDVRNRFVLSGIWALDYTKNPLLRDFQVSTIVTLESGRPYNLLAGVDLDRNGDNLFPGDRPDGISRNLGITPGYANVDLRLTRSISINERIRFQGFVEAFNLFNRVNISEISRIFPPDAQGRFSLPPKDGGRFIATPDRYRNAFSPRQFQLGFRLTF